jgi:phage gp29-like protein
MATSRILGPDGQPIDLGAVTREPQTARVTSLQRELQSHPTRGLTPSRLARILDAAESGDLVAQFELFEDMEEKDGHIASEMNKRRRALLLEWDIVPPDNASAAEKSATAQLSELMQELPDFEDALFDATDAIGKGFACLEIEWHRVNGFWLPRSLTHRPQTWFQLQRGYRQELRLRTGGMGDDGLQGEPLRPFGWIVHVHRAKSGYLERSAMFRQLVWTYLFKNYSVGDLAELLEIWGIPLRLGKYPASATDKEKATLLRALASIGHNAAGIVPEGMLLEFHAVAQGDPKAFEIMIDWCERNQSKVILGGTLTSGADGKSSTNALGNVHNEVRKDLRDSDVRQLNGTLSRDLVYAIATLNGLAPDGTRRAARFVLSAQEPDDMSVYATALPPLVNMGLRPTLQWTHEKLGIPIAQAGEATLLPAQAAPGGPPGALAAMAAQLNGTPAARPATPPQLMAPRLAQDLAPAVDGWIDQVRQLVMRASSLEEIRDGLEKLLPGMTLDQYAAAMAEALRAAQLAGRYEVLREAGGMSA